MNARKIANLALLILFPIAWFAPLLHAGLLPLFSLSSISVISGLQALWSSDVFLALLVTFFAIFAPYMKVIGTGLVRLINRASDCANGITFTSRAQVIS